MNVREALLEYNYCHNDVVFIVDHLAGYYPENYYSAATDCKPDFTVLKVVNVKTMKVLYEQAQEEGE